MGSRLKKFSMIILQVLTGKFLHQLPSTINLFDNTNFYREEAFDLLHLAHLFCSDIVANCIVQWCYCFNGDCKMVLDQTFHPQLVGN